MPRCRSNGTAASTAARTRLAACALILAVGAVGARAADTDYDIRDEVLIHTADGATLSATVVRKKGTSATMPTLLRLDIYTDAAALRERGKEAADHGYVGVMVDTRGKRLSSDPILPYEHEAHDAREVIDWIVHQGFSNGVVGMYGGSYSGFTAWAATKHLHPALKTIATSAAAMPGMGLPMEHNVFLNANYGWAFYVAGSRTLDEQAYRDEARWQRLESRWYESGRPYRAIDEVDGRPNPWLQRWLKHPAFDKYWQEMGPYEDDFAAIRIPVLSITGYYDDAQGSALGYLKSHVQYFADAEHYLVIGPYDQAGSHAASKAPLLRGFATDAAAQFSTPDLIFQWMDYVLKGAPKPALLKDKINFEVMGLNEWHHAPSLRDMSLRQQRLYLSDAKDKPHYRLLPKHPDTGKAFTQQVDLTDRKLFHNAHGYPDPLILERLDQPTELVFSGDALTSTQLVSGSFSGELNVTVNKKDLDLGVTVFEQFADGRLLHLAHWIGRASFAADQAERRLLVPGKLSRIGFETNVVSRQLVAGSRLLLLLDVNANPQAQLNYGTGKDVSDESVTDAGEPLKVSWRADSYLNVPLER